ncbi:MAG: dihydropteroate synthase [Hypericibacter sp.]
MAGAARKGKAGQSGPAKPKTKSASRAGERESDRRLYLFPEGILSGAAARDAVKAGQALKLAGGPLAFTHIALIERDAKRRASQPFGLPAFERWMAGQPLARRRALAKRLDQLTAARPRFAGLAMDRPRIMGVINVTPDSFSDGGRFLDAGKAIAHGEALVEAGAEILDIGGESTRPGAEPVSADEEIRRVVPVIEALRKTGIALSIDTRHARVMAVAVGAGAKIINDVTALTGDPDSLRVAAASGAGVVLMHMRGEPRTMQKNPRYREAALDLYDYFTERLDTAEAAGLSRRRIAIDPGIGFGKAIAHNQDILNRLALLHGLGCPILLGVSRKSFIAKLSRGEDAGHRLPGSLAAALWGLKAGVQMIRVHDVAETAQAVAVWQALAAGVRPGNPTGP